MPAGGIRRGKSIDSTRVQGFVVTIPSINAKLVTKSNRSAYTFIKNQYQSAVRLKNWSYKDDFIWLMKKKFPIRSGKLLDYLINTLITKKRELTKNLWGVDTEYRVPHDRPLIIHNPAHTPPAEGQSRMHAVINPEVNELVHLKSVTPDGMGVYGLNDPKAISHYADYSLKMMENDLVDDFVDFFKGMTIKVVI